MLYLRSNSESTSQHTPSYFFSGTLNDWVVFYLDAKKRAYVVSTQLIAFPDSSVQLLTQAPAEHHEKLVSLVMTAFRDKSYKSDIRLSLPEDFSPRLLLEGKKCVLVARSQADIERLTVHVQQLQTTGLSTQRLQLMNTGRERYHFRWSKLNWAQFCAKTALESLCLFEGGEKCLSHAFRYAREFVLQEISCTEREVVFTETGPRGEADTPHPVFMDLTVEQNASVSIAALMTQAQPGMHVVTLYEMSGWVLASVVFAGFPPSVLVLGGPGEHLADIYQLIYDDKEATFDFVRLAHDQSKPLIPIPISGDCLSELTKTYRLVHF